MFDPIYASATEIAQAIREKRISALGTLEAHLDRIARLNGAIHAIIVLDAEGARRRAQEADDALARGELWGPLHGVPMTIFDLIDVAGMRTTVAGNPKMANHVPTKDPTIVARFRKAGAVIMGKSNDDHDFYGDARLFPLPNNPWDHSRVLTGCGGPAATVAAGFSALEIGGDMGSMQQPAHYAGIFALRPTNYRIPAADVYGNRNNQPHRNIPHTPVARSVEDLRLALTVLAGPDGVTIDVPPVPLDEYSHPTLRDLRIAWAPRIPGVVIDDEIASAIETLAGDLQRAGIHMEECLPKIDFTWMLDAHERVFSKQIEVSREIAGGEPSVTYGEYLRARIERDKVWHIWNAFMKDWDALLVPVGSIVAPRRGTTEQIVNGVVLTPEETHDYWPACKIAPATGLPTVIMPLGRNSEGLPFGAQLLGRQWHDMRLLAIAEQVTGVAGGFVRPPGY